MTVMVSECLLGHNCKYNGSNNCHNKLLESLKDHTYLGNQLESEFGGTRCFGVLANMDFIMVSSYEAEGENPELILFKKR